MPNPLRNDIAVCRRMLAEMSPHRGRLVGVFLVALAGTPLPLLAPIPIKIAVDSAMYGHPLPGFLQPLVPEAVRTPGALLAVAAVMVIVVALLERLHQMFTWIYQTYTGERLVLDFRARLFRHAQRLSLAYHDRKGSADSLYRIVHDAPSAQHLTVFGLLPMVSSTLTLAGIIAVAAWIHLQFALIALTVVPLLAVLILRSRPLVADEWTRIKTLDRGAMSVIQEVLGALRVVKAFAKESDEVRRYLGVARKGARGRVRLAFVSARLSVLVGLTTAAGTAAVLFIGFRQVQAGLLTVGDVLLVLGYISQIYGPIEKLTKNVGELQAGVVGARRAFALLDEQPDVPEKPAAVPLRRAAGHIAFRHVSFGYEAGQPILVDVVIDVRPGSRVGIAGPTGAGKTTLVNLLARFYDPLEGAILLDGVDLRDYRLADLRSQFAIMPQEPILFSTTIAENIAYARPGATESEIIAAATAAKVHDFIASLPEGYATLVGERGMRLSGGERQRLSLARAFLKDAPILILDEPTSSVDLDTESAIVDSLARLMRGRTTFMITHRVGSLGGCDVRLHVDHGRVVQAGCHALVADIQGATLA